MEVNCLVETCKGEIILLKVEEDIPLECLDALVESVQEAFKKIQKEYKK